MLKQPRNIMLKGDAGHIVNIIQEQRAQLAHPSHTRVKLYERTDGNAEEDREQIMPGQPKQRWQQNQSDCCCVVASFPSSRSSRHKVREAPGIKKELLPGQLHTLRPLNHDWEPSFNQNLGAEPVKKWSTVFRAML